MARLRRVSRCSVVKASERYAEGHKLDVFFALRSWHDELINFLKGKYVAERMEERLTDDCLRNRQ